MHYAFQSAEKIRRGITLFNSSRDIVSKPRITFSQGTVLARNLIKDLPYGVASYLPLGPWREPTVEELKILVNHEPPSDFSNCVGVIKIPDSIFNEIKKTGLSEICSEKDVDELIQTDLYKLALKKLAQHLSSFKADETTEVYHRPILNGPSLISTTFDYQNKFYLGLHLDSWDKMPYHLRHQCANRVSINFGQHDRFFYFINLPFREILAELTPEECRNHSTQIIEAFLKRHPGYPVVQVRVSPGEAYVAPTENIIHDGSSLGQKVRDIHLTVRGFFNLAPKVQKYDVGPFSRLMGYLRRTTVPTL